MDEFRGYLDWTVAEEHLKEIERGYTEIGSPGMMALMFSIMPLRIRFNAGERTEELHTAIMELE